MWLLLLLLLLLAIFSYLGILVESTYPAINFQRMCLSESVSCIGISEFSISGYADGYFRSYYPRIYRICLYVLESLVLSTTQREQDQSMG